MDSRGGRLGQGLRQVLAGLGWGWDRSMDMRR